MSLQAPANEIIGEWLQDKEEVNIEDDKIWAEYGQ